MKNYEPRFTPGEATFPTELQTAAFLEQRIAMEGAIAYLISSQLRFALGNVRVCVYVYWGRLSVRLLLMQVVVSDVGGAIVLSFARL